MGPDSPLPLGPVPIPGLQYDSTINEWHTCPESGRINASNPCSEYMFLDDTACNLASLNLMKFAGETRVVGHLKATSMRAALDAYARNVGPDGAVPVQGDRQASYEYRTLGLGFANIGALLMSMGLATTPMKAARFVAACQPHDG